jgi:putative transposase
MAETQPQRKRIQHFHEPGDLHELTFSCYRRLPLLTNDDWRTLLARSIDAAGLETGFKLAAFVLMPEHVHLLVVPTLRDPRIDEYLAKVKQPFSKSIKELLRQQNSPLLARLMVRERPGKICFRFWQEGPGYDRNLNSSKAIAASLDYIHLNPVRRGLVDRAVDWKWSSASWYLLNPPQQQRPGLPLIHRLPAEVLDQV